MKLLEDVVLYIKNAVATAKLVGVEGVVIERNLVAAMNEQRTAVILQLDDKVDLPFDRITIDRFDLFLSRLALVEGQEKFEVEYLVSPKTNEAQLLTMKCKGTKVEYRCANPKTVKTPPRELKEQFNYATTLTADAVQLLAKGMAAMKSDSITLVSNDSGVMMELVDGNGDVFSHKFAERAENVVNEDEPANFVHRYEAKLLLTMMKHDPQATILVSKRGLLLFTINDVNVYVLPQV